MVSPSTQGTPQGGPLSPLRSNILLTDLDRELERRGHAFCRYADDCNIHVRSEAAGARVLASITQFLEERLRLNVNAAKSAVDRPRNRKFPGCRLTAHKAPKLRIPPTSIDRLKAKVGAVFRRCPRAPHEDSRVRCGNHRTAFSDAFRIRSAMMTRLRPSALAR